MAEFTHFDTDGNALMVDVGSKSHTNRIAIVKGHIKMQPKTLMMITDGTAQKGDVLGTKSNSNKLYDYIKFKPNTSVERGIRLFIGWYKNYYN